MFASSAFRLIPRPITCLALGLVIAVVAAMLNPLAVASAQAADAMPCEVSWDGGGGDNRFSNAANWSGDAVPAINDDVCIDSGSAPNLVVLDLATRLTVNSLRTDSAIEIRTGEEGGLRLVTGGHVGSVTLQSGELTTDGALTTYGVSQSGGLLAGAGNVDVAGRYSWTGGSTAGAGITTVGAAPSGPAGLALGTGSMSAAQRHLRTTVGGSIAKDTSVQLKDGAGIAFAGETTVDSAADGPASAISGTGDLEIAGSFHLAAHASFSSSVTTRVTAAATLDLVAGDNELSLAGEATVAGAVTLGRGSVFAGDGNGHLTLTDSAGVNGAGTLAAQQQSTVTSAAAVDVDTVDVDGALVLDDDAKGLKVLIDHGQVEVKPEALFSAGTLTQREGQVKGELAIAGDADLTDATWEGRANVEQVFSVEGATTVHGSLTLRNAVLDGNDVTLAPGAAESAHVALQQQYAGLSVRGKLRQTDAWAVISEQEGTDGEFEASDVVIGAGQQLRVDPAWTLSPDQHVTVAAKGSLWVQGHFVDNGTLENSGDVVLDGDTEIRKDVASAAGSKLLIGSTSAATPTVTLVGAPVVGGDGAVVTNNYFLTGSGVIAGKLTNNGRVAPSRLLTIQGDYTQDVLAALDVTLADGVPVGLRVTGTATLDGSLKVDSPETGLHDTHWTLLSASRVQGSLQADLENECDDVEYTATTVDLVSSACFTVADTEVTEGEPDAEVTARLSRPMPGPVRLDYTVLAGTAGAGDFAGGSGSVTVPAGETTAVVKVPILDDQVTEQDEAFDVLVTSSEVASNGGEATVTIHDDDDSLVFGAKGISALGSDQQVRGIGRKYAVGQFDNQGTRGWVYDLAAEGIAEVQGGLVPTTISNSDVLVGSCGTGTTVHVCVRDHGVTTSLPDSGGTTIVAINDKGQLVGRRTAAHNSGVLYVSPTAQPIVLDPIAGSEYSQALDINEDGTVVGMSRVGGKDVIWTRTPAGTVTRLGEIAGDRMHLVDLAKISRTGTVLVKASTLVANSWTPSSYRWTARSGLVADPAGMVLDDMNAAGDLVGTLNGRAKIWRDGKVFDLTASVAQGQLGGATFRWPHAISDQGVIVGEGTIGSDATPHMFVLTPPGAGCYVCAEVSVREAKYPHKGDMVPAGDEVVEGNPAEIAVELHNTDFVPQTVKVALTGDDGKAIGTERTIALAAGERQTVTTPWTTDGRAWKNGADAGTTGIVAQVSDEAGDPVDESSARIRVVPRPVVLVHREFYGPNSWSSYAAKLEKAHVGWKAAAVDTLDTTMLTANTIGRNARLLSEYVARTQGEQNAWQVDLLAEGAGGLISRSYIHHRMKDVETVTPVRRLLMLGVMNEGTRCADMFGLPGTVQLGPAMVESFNKRTFERRGVEFSALAGTAGWFTCGWPATGDDVVSQESALSGVDDTMSLPIRKSQLRSTEVFEKFVLPRLSNGSAAATPAPGVFAAAAALASAAAAVSTGTPQLLDGAERVDLAPGETVRVPETVPAGLDAIAATALAPDTAGSITLGLERGGVLRATGTADEGDYVSAVADNPTAGSWTLVVSNNGSAAITVPVALEARGAAARLVASADQVGLTHQVRVTAHLEGTALATPLRRLRATVASGGGENQAVLLLDDGTAGDATAGDGTYTGVLAPVPDGLLVLDVETDDPAFYRRTPIALAVETLDDGPGDDAPVAFDQQVTLPAGEVTRIDVDGADPEGSAVTFDVLRKPAHGTVGGEGPHFEYRPADGYHGTDSFTFRVNDGTQWSEPATVSITVDRARSELVLTRPDENKAIQGKPFTADVLVKGPAGEAVTGGTVTYHFGTQTVTAEVSSGHAAAEIPNAGMAAGRHDLDASYDGTSSYAPSTLHTQIELVGNHAPAPGMEAVSGEAGYRTRIQVFAGDIDANATTFAIDWDDDGALDETKEIPATADDDPTVDQRAAMFFHSYPDAWEGHARVVVTDAAGATGEATTTVHIAEHRAQGPLERITVGDKPVRLVEVSGDGRHVLYEDRNQYAPNHPTAAYGVLDRKTGTHEWASVRPDGSIEDQPHSGVLSLDGRTVAWVGSVTPDGDPGALFVRDLESDTTQRITAVTGEPATLRGKRLFLVVQRRLLALDVTTLESTLLSGTADGTVLTVDAANPGHVAASPDGSHVAFGTPGGQLWAVDIDSAGVPTPAVRLATPGVDGSAVAPSGLSISDNGRDVVFTSDEEPLVAADTNGTADVYHHDRTAGTTELVSRTTSGKAGDKASSFASMSADGQRVLFHSEATDLVAGDTNGVGDEFLRDLGAGTTRRLSVEPRDGTQADEESTVSLGLSSDGRYAFFESFAQVLVPDQTWSTRDLYVRDLGEVTPQCHVGTLAEVDRTTVEDTAVDVPLAQACENSTWSVVDGPAHGTLSGTGAMRSYAPAADWNGSDTFTYRVTHGTESATGTARITVSPVNDAPVAKDLAGETRTGQPLPLTFAGTDVDGDALTFEVATPPAHGALTGSGAARSYTPVAGWSGVETFTYRASDGKLSATGTVHVAVSANPPSTNHAPVAKNLTACGLEDQTVKVTLSATDVDGDALTYDVATAPAHGMVTGTGTARTYTPSANWNGTDTFTYRVGDGTSSSTATVKVTVAPVNDAPTTKAISVQGREDQPVKVTLPGSDVDTSALTWKVLTTPAHGSLTGSTAARTYTPKANWNGTEILTFSVSDGKFSATGTLSLVVTPVNDAPKVSLAGPTKLTNKDIGQFTASPTDVDGDKVSCRISWGDGTTAAAGCQARHTWSRTGTFTVTVTATDAVGATGSATRTVTVTRCAAGVAGRLAV